MNIVPQKMLVTTALPYANGPLHLGHILEAIQADIWVRFQKLRGHECHFISGDDAHGTPIMLKAQAQGLSPEALIERIYQSHLADFQGFGIDFDHFYTTHSAENKALCQLFYERLRARGDIVQRSIAQAFDPIKQLFLPDRYVKGGCPKCEAPDQYGDNCEQCGATYSPMDLKNPLSVLSGVAPLSRDSEHYFFCLEHYQDFLKEWVAQADHLQPEIAKKLSEWFQTGLAQWDISRDAPYFGFKIPDTEEKYFYVWLDAPMGYMSIFKHYLASSEKNTHDATAQAHRLSADPDEKHPNFEDYWSSNSTAALYHFIGKDIIYFHGLFWPALLKGAGFRTPTRIFAHGFLTVNGQKMSKSRGTFIQAQTYLQHLDADYLRYYFASKLNSSIEDLDLNMDDFLAKTNADLVGKFVNIASRSAGLLEKHFNNVLSPTLSKHFQEDYQSFVDAGAAIAKYYEERAFNRVVQQVMQLADHTNRLIDLHKPWVLAKSSDPLDRQALWDICSMGIHCFRLLALYLKPIVPKLAQRAALFLNSPLEWDCAKQILLGHQLNPFEALIKRIDTHTLEALMNEVQHSQEDHNHKALNPSAPVSATAPIKPAISIDQFNQVDLRVGKIIHAEGIPEAQKLIKLSVDLGEERPRQIFAGIKEAYEPESLIGKWVAVVANLAPRTMRFGVSEGMLLASGPGGSDVWLIEPHPNCKPGTPIK